MASFENKDDHDILIELRTIVNTFTQQYAKDMLELKNGTATKLANHDIRIKSLEATRQEVNPKDKAERLIALEDTVHDFFVQMKTARWSLSIISSTGGAIIFWLLTQLPSLIKDWQAVM